MKQLVDQFYLLKKEIERLEVQSKNLREKLLKKLLSRPGRVIEGNLAVVSLVHSTRASINREVLTAKLTKILGEEQTQKLLAECTTVSEFDSVIVKGRV